MTELANLSKYQGGYDLWTTICKRYSLRWTSGNESLQSMQRFFNPDLNLSDMIGKVKEMMRVLPVDMCAVIKHAVLTGLRPGEACESVRLLLNSENVDTDIIISAKIQEQYYNPERQALEHFRFPKIFLRRTKRSSASSRRSNFRGAKLGGKAPPTTYNSIRMACLHRHINMDT